MAKYQVQVHPRVASQLVQHAEFIARVSKPAAQRFRVGFSEILRRMQENPYQFPSCDDPNLPSNFYRKALFGTWYKVIFYIVNQQVFVDAVADCRSESQIL